MNTFDVIKRPLVTEKAVAMRETANKYVFAVDPRATKCDVRLAVEKLFRVHVVAVHTINLTEQPRRSLRGGRRSNRAIRWKKAIVRVKSGEKIDLFEGV